MYYLDNIFCCNQIDAASGGGKWNAILDQVIVLHLLVMQRALAKADSLLAFVWLHFTLYVGHRNNGTHCCSAAISWQSYFFTHIRHSV